MKTNFRFMRHYKALLAFAGAMVLASIVLVAVRGFNYSIDFTGGNMLQLEFPEKVEVGQVREAMSKVGYGSAVIQSYSDTGVMIRMQGSSDLMPNELRDKIVAAVDALHSGAVKLVNFEMVGPTVGGELRNQALLASTIALAGILLYITVRFRFRFALVSVLALVHDTLLTLGLFSLLQQEVGMTFIAAILTTIGYSLNNTIVILDRVRENWHKLAKIGMEQLLDDSINQTLARTINTSLTTFMPVLAFYVWGGPVLAGFSLAIMCGIIVGGFSSACVTTSILYAWQLKSPER
ncbi:MAG: protein translocase subunit SecF [Pyramidobacter sp.]|nr:protein translocase subunit SecF [Pyramidobacter sp.]